MTIVNETLRCRKTSTGKHWRTIFVYKAHKLAMPPITNNNKIIIFRINLENNSEKSCEDTNTICHERPYIIVI